MTDTNNLEKVNRYVETKCDEGIELPKGFSSWSEVLKDGFSPISSKEVENLLKALESTQGD